MISTEKKDSVSTPPPELQHFFDKKKELIKKKEELQAKHKKISRQFVIRALILFFGLGIPISILGGIIITQLGIWASPVIFIIPILLFLGPLKQKSEVSSALRALRNEYELLEIEYKEAYRIYKNPSNVKENSPEKQNAFNEKKSAIYEEQQSIHKQREDLIDKMRVLKKKFTSKLIIGFVIMLPIAFVINNFFDISTNILMLIILIPLFLFTIVEQFSMASIRIDLRELKLKHENLDMANKEAFREHLESDHSDILDANHINGTTHFHSDWGSDDDSAWDSDGGFGDDGFGDDGDFGDGDSDGGCDDD